MKKLFEEKMEELQRLAPESVKQTDGIWSIYNEGCGWEKVTVGDIDYVEACISF